MYCQATVIKDNGRKKMLPNWPDEFLRDWKNIDDSQTVDGPEFKQQPFIW